MSSENNSASEKVEIELPPRPQHLKPPPKIYLPSKSPSIPKRSVEDDEVEEIIHRIHQVAQQGNVGELETMLKNGVNPNLPDRLGRTPLHYAVSIECRCTNCLSNAETCTKLLINTQIADVNAQDNEGNTPLHLAIDNQLAKCAEQLISGGADVCLKSASREEAVCLLVKKLPDTMTYLLNECIFVDQYDPKDEQCVLKVDFSPLVGNPKFKTADGRTSSLMSTSSRSDLRISWQREMRLLLSILQNPATRAWRGKILTHPVVRIFMEQEWKRVQKFFIASFVFYLLYVILYTVFILEVYLFKCPTQLFNLTHNNHSKSEEFQQENKTHWLLVHNNSSAPLNGTSEYEYAHEITDTRYEQFHQTSKSCQIATGVGPVVTIILVLTAVLALAELGRLVITPKMYIQSKLNFGTWIFIVLVLVTTAPNLASQTTIGPKQYQAAAFTVFLAWAFVLQQISKFPQLGKYIEMFGVVLRRCGFFVLSFSPLFIAFALAFWILLATRPAFQEFQTALLKTLVMMTGEMDYNTMFYSNPALVSGSPLVHVLFAAFVFVVCIVFMNLVIGLTVQDIQKLQADGELRRMTRLILEIHRLESLIFSKRIPRALGDRLKESISVLQPNKQGRREGLIFEFRPNSRDDRSVSKHLKLDALQVASLSYEKFRANQCSKPNHVENGNGSQHELSLHHPVLLRRLNRQHYKLIAVQSSIYRGRKRR